MKEVWRAYSESASYLLRPGGRVIATTIAENAPLMLELFGAKPQRWQPSIPHLVYQYCCYVNYSSDRLGTPNPEVPE
jgi:EEF1A lysine methyltransferase 1